jgi:cysteine synthase A
MPMQFDNPANTNIHKVTTAQEILKDFPEGLDYIITGVGTGGHITGVAEVLKNKFPKLKVFAVEPELSPVLSGGAPGPHPIQGIGAGFVPSILDTKLLDGIIKVSKDDAFNFTKRAAKEEGLFIGISSGASLAAVDQKIKEIPKGSRILTFSYDTGERYLSIEGLF